MVRRRSQAEAEAAQRRGISAAGPGARAAGGRQRDRRQLAGGEVLVAGRQIARRQLIEAAGDVGQHAVQHLDPRQLIAARRAFVAGHRAEQLVGEFAQPLLAGDRPALLGGDDLLAQHVGPGREGGETGLQRIAVGQGRGSPIGAGAHRVDPRRQVGHAAEEVADPLRGGELLLAIGQGVGGAAVEGDGEGCVITLVPLVRRTV